MKAIFIILLSVIYINSLAQTADEFFNNGNTKFTHKDYTGAIADYSKAIALNPKNANFWFNRGIAKNSLPDYSGAIEDYTKAIEINPTLADAYFNRGIYKILLNQKDSGVPGSEKSRRIR